MTTELLDDVLASSGTVRDVLVVDILAEKQEETSKLFVLDNIDGLQDERQ